FELRRTSRALATPLFLITLKGLSERLAVLLFLDDGPAAQALEQSPHDLGTHLRALANQAFDRDVLAEMLGPQIPNLHSAVPGEAVDPEVDLRRLLSGRHEATDRFLARHQDVQRVPQEIDRHVRVEAIQVEERGFEAPGLGIAVGHRDDFREVPHLLEELLPLRDELILRKLDEHFLPPAIRGGYCRSAAMVTRWYCLTNFSRCSGSWDTSVCMWRWASGWARSGSGDSDTTKVCARWWQAIPSRRCAASSTASSSRAAARWAKGTFPWKRRPSPRSCSRKRAVASASLSSPDGDKRSIARCRRRENSS